MPATHPRPLWSAPASFVHRRQNRRLISPPFKGEALHRNLVTLCSPAACSDSVKAAIAIKKRWGFTAALYTKTRRKFVSESVDPS
jgi:hypothetical protein